VCVQEVQENENLTEQRERDLEFLRLAVARNVLTQDQADVLTLIPRIEHYSVRPAEEKYDRDYYVQNLEKVID